MIAGQLTKQQQPQGSAGCGDSVQEITFSHRIQVGCYVTVTYK
jgi:hypothetical protein